MNNKEYVDHLLNIVNMPTYYSNKYPNNLGYVHEDGRRSFDCWNLIKSVLNGYDEHNNQVGYYQKDLSKTGDTNADGLIKQCHNVSTDFSKISIPGAFLYYYDGTHAGTFVGDYEIGGKHYNVIECTAAWDKRVLWSWVDANGTRRRYKGSSSVCGKWSKYGYFNMLGDEGGTPAPAPTPTPTTSIPVPVLKKGSKGQEVVKLQNKIMSMGIALPRYGADGDFGAETENGVKEMQKKLFVNGVYDQRTADALKSF